MAEVFEISPPKRMKTNDHAEEEEFEILHLAPFKPLPKVIFRNVKVNVSVKRRLVIKNPSHIKLTAELSTLPSDDRGFNFSFKEVDLNPGEESILEITWTPVKAGTWTDRIPVRTSSKLKSEIVIISSSVHPPANKKGKKSVGSRIAAKPTVLAKKLVMSKPSKFQSPKPSVTRSCVIKQVQIAPSLPRTAASPCRRQTFLINAENKENSPILPRKKQLTETTPPNFVQKIQPLEKIKHDISRRFEDFVLSPLNPNLNLQKTRSSALDDLVMSPVILPSENASHDADFVDGDASANSRALIPIRQKTENDDPPDLRRATFDVGNLTEFHVSKKLSDVPLPEIYIENEEENENFSDSLEEANPSPFPKPVLSPQKQQVFGSTQDPIPAFEGLESFMNSTIKFDLPLPSEDPRRCSTGVKVFPLSPPSKLAVSKNLFDIITSPPEQRLDRRTFAIEFDNSLQVDCFNGGISGSMDDRLSSETFNKDRLSSETYNKDRLSSETYDKDRLSSETYDKDRLSTSTYIKDCLSTEPCIKEEHSRESCTMYDDFRPFGQAQGERNHSSAIHSPRMDLSSAKSPLVSIKEEDINVSIESETETMKKIKSTVFTVEFPTKSAKAEALQDNLKPKLCRPLLKGRRVLEVSPTLKKTVLLLKNSKPASADQPRSSKEARTNSRLSMNFSGKQGRRLSMSAVDSKHALSANLPQSRLSLCKSEQPVFKIPRGSKRIAQLMAQKSEVLHNLDDILDEVTNIDPFAATTTTDPFLNRAIFNDPAWMTRQEMDMIKWLNALLTPPAELEANTDVGIDIGDLWQKTCRMKDVSLAPSREEVSSEHFDKHSRLTSLRKAALSLIRSMEVRSVLQKISVRVDQKVLAVREDRDLHIDVGLQQQVLELLLCYNPLWLRIGLEAIFGRTVPLKTNNDYVGLTSFIVHNLLSDDYIRATYSHPTVPHLKLPGFQQEMKKFTLKKFLFLVYFLDTAKRRQLISHDPCLFMRSAAYKESRDILVAFARDLLAGMGNIIRYLASLDCQLTVKQTYLDEFEYAVKTLLDLRDGIRLVRVMELICHDHSLHDRLRAPAISKLQKVHNVEVALDALKTAGYVLGGDIRAKDIVAGHREKTLSLLWQIIYKFQAPRFTAAALVIQHWWRRGALVREVDRRIRARKRARLEAAAVVIQAAWRGLLGRRRAVVLRERRSRLEEARGRAALVLQTHWRRHAAEMILLRAQRAASLIALWFRGATETRRLRQDFLRRRAAAVVIQAHWRGFLTRLRFTHLRQMSAALRIQTWFRRRRAARLMIAAVDLARHWVEERRRRQVACCRLQVRVRAWLAMRRERLRFLELREAVVVVQRRYRARHAMQQHRQCFVSLKHAVVVVQQRWRALRAMKIQTSCFQEKRAAAVVVQRWLRARWQRRNFLQLRSAARLLQQRWRARQLTKIARVDFIFQRRAAVLLQRAVRAWLAGRRERSSYLKLRSATIVIQRKVRARAMMRRQRNARFAAAATVLQRRWRARQAMKGPRQEFQELRGAACVLQQRFRARQAMRVERERYQRLRSAALLIQTRFRARKQMQKARNRYMSVLKATRTIQSHWRAMQAMKRERADFVALRHAACVLQSKYRAQLSMREERNHFLTLRSAAVIIQRRFHANKKMERDQARFQTLRKAALTIQQLRRAQLAMRAQYAEFSSLRKAACVLQSRYRALLAMRVEHSKYQQIRLATILIQRKFIAYRCMKEERTRFLSLHKATITIQRRWRAQQSMIRERDRFQKLQHVTVFLQRQWRAVQLAKVDLHKYQEIRGAAATLQTWWRATLLAKRERRQYQLLLTSVKLIQGWWRGKIIMDQQREKYQTAQAAAVVIQKYIRGVLARKKYLKQKEEDLQERDLKLKTSAAIKIQALWRGYVSRKTFEAETAKMKLLSQKAQASTCASQCMKDRINDLCIGIGLDNHSVGGAVYILNALNTVCMISPVLCEEMVSNDIVVKLFSLLCGVNRGVADSEIARLSSKILLVLCKNEKTCEAVWKDGSFLNLFPLLMKKWISVDDSVLLNFITILWLFSQSPMKAKVILADEKLKSTILFFVSKYKNRKSKTTLQGGLLPTLTPNWGSLRKETRPFAFEDTVYGLRALCYKLKLDINF